jgi:DNA processing protein
VAILNYTYLHYQIGLTLLYRIGPIKAKALLRSVNSIEDLFLLSPSELEKISGFKASFIKESQRAEALLKSVEVVNHLQRNQIYPLFYDDPNYPRRLKNCIDAPLMLYQKGSVSLNPSKIVAIVGTRAATSYGKQICENLIQSFSGSDITVVSGLALGIDAHAHRLCLEHNVPTIGVLGHGLDRIYPAQNRSLANKMLNDGGLITEFIPGTDPDRENFPKRNRIVAGISDATIVIESKTKGGSLITAHLANDYNRDVFAFPGNVNTESSQGCNRLIANQKAHLIQNPQDFLTLMNWTESSPKKPVQRILFPKLNTKQKSIVEIISKSAGVQIDVISIKTNLPITLLNTELFHLEMEGVIRSLPGKTYSLA